MSYTKQGFKNDMVLDASHLIALENGILANQAEIQNVAASIPSSTPSGSTSTVATVPSHWTSYMNTKIKEINDLADSLGGKADCFIFIADQHKNTGAGNEASLMNYIIENTSVKKIVFGGDIVQGSNSDVEIFRAYQKALSKDAIVLAMRGNHDIWGNANEKHFWNIFYRPLETKANTTSNMWYYYDNGAQKIRYIVTDSIYSSSDGTSNLTSAEQIKWMQDRILELDESWTVLILHHGIWTASKTATMPINNDGQLMIDSLDEIYHDARCNIAGYYVAHCHRDYDTLTDNGYLLVGTTLDCCSSGQASYDINYPTRTKGTTTEHAFDVVFFIPETQTIKTIRIGAGKNREFNYMKKSGDSSVTGVAIEGIQYMKPNSSLTVSAKIAPAYAKNKNVTWLIENGADLISITPNGLNCTVTALGKEGQASIKVVTEEGAFSAIGNIEITTSNSRNLTNEFTWTPGTLTHSTGSVGTSDTNWLYSNAVDISDYSSLTFAHCQTTTTATSLGYAIYDANMNRIDSANNGGVSYVPVEKTITLPDNAKYFRCMWMNTTHTQYDSNINDISKFYCYGNL